jgi:hypothetical protein
VTETKRKPSGRVTPEKMDKIVEIIRAGGTLTSAAESVELHRTTINVLKHKDEDFARRLAAAKPRKTAFKFTPRPRTVATAEQVETYIAHRRAGNSKASSLSAAGTTQTALDRAVETDAAIAGQYAECERARQEQRTKALQEQRAATLSLTNPGVRVPTDELASIVRRGLREGRENFIRTFARIAGLTDDAANKRVRYVLEGHPPTTDADTADELVLAAGLNISREGLTHLAGGAPAAKQMAAAWAPEWTEQERKELARKLVSFSRGLTAALIDRLDLLEPAEAAA